MKIPNRLSKFFAVAMLAFAGFFSSVAGAEPTTVPFVDLGRYVGDWYQISHVPLEFEAGPCACTRQRLTATEMPDTISVFNSCNKTDSRGPVMSIGGVAKNLDVATNAKFEVDFNMPMKGSYWIAGLDADYRYAVVTNADGSALYILSKTPTLAEDLYAKALVDAAAAGLDVTKLEMTDQNNCTYPR